MIGYCVDTSAFVTFCQDYPSDVFSSLWSSLEVLVGKDHIHAPTLVMQELARQDDDLKEWAKRHKGIFVRVTPQIYKFVQDANSDFPTYTNPDATNEEADLYVIAVAKLRGFTVVTSERLRPKSERPRIPNVCVHYGIQCISPIEFMRQQAWKF